MLNKNQEQINEEQDSLMHEIKESNKDFHDNCDANECEACIGL